MTPDEAEARVCAAVRAAEAAAAALTDALREARESGVSWARLSEASGLSRQALRYRLGALDGEGGYIAERRARGEAASIAAEAERVRVAYDGQDPAPIGTEWVTATAAANMLGIARPTLYTWIDEGRVPTVTREGRRVVPVEPGTGRIPVRPRGAYVS